MEHNVRSMIVNKSRIVRISHQLHDRPENDERHSGYRSTSLLDDADGERNPLCQEAEQAHPQEGKHLLRAICPMGRQRVTSKNHHHARRGEMDKLYQTFEIRRRH